MVYSILVDNFVCQYFIETCDALFFSIPGQLFRRLEMFRFPLTAFIVLIDLLGTERRTKIGFYLDKMGWYGSR